MDLKIENYCYFNNVSKINKYNAPVLYFCCRDRQFNFHPVFVCDKKNLAPEMYIPANERFIAEQQEQIIKIEKAPDSNYKEKTCVCYTTFPWEVGRLRKLFTHTYLSDVKWKKMCIQKMGLTSPYIEVPDDFNDRWLTVNDIKQLPEEKHFYVPIRFIAWDIETDASSVFPNFNGWKDAEKCPIISISCYDSYTECYHRFCWHPKVERTHCCESEFERKGSFYVPAFKGKKDYNRSNKVVDHFFPTETEMLVGFFNWFNEVRPDADFSFFGEGGYRMSSRKSNSRKRFFTGFDCPYLYHRCKTLGILNEMQKMSPLPNHTNGVKWRVNGKEVYVEILGLTQIDYIFTNDIFGYHKKFDDFRGGRLEDFASFFLGFGKIKHEEEIFEMWRDDIPYVKDEIEQIEKRRNYVKELLENDRNNSRKS